MNMQIGPGCKPCVKAGDHVDVGQMIGEPIAGMSVPIHTGVSGTVKKISEVIKSDGREMQEVAIENDGEFTVHESVKPREIKTKDDFIEAVRDAGLVGLGGAGFPTHFKLNPPPDKPIDMLLINAMECEPYITSDDHICRMYADEIIAGTATVLKWTGIKQAIIGLEDNKPEAAEALREALAKSDTPEKDKIEIKILQTMYPQGAEKVLIRHLADREVPSGGLPHDVGVLVMNVGTVRYVEYFIQTGMPLTRKIITLDGSAVRKPGNYDVPIGASIADILEASGGTRKTPEKVIMGGPMMGVAVDRLDSPILKNNNAILAFGEEDALLPGESPCIHCGRCVRACPMYLMPTELDRAARALNVEDLKEFAVMDCIECGSCTFVCPAKRFLVQNIRVGKSLVRQDAQKQKAKEA